MFPAARSCQPAKQALVKKPRIGVSGNLRAPNDPHGPFAFVPLASAARSLRRVHVAVCKPARPSTWIVRARERTPNG